MKKILLLFLAIAGMVSTASAKTIYLIDNWGKNSFRLYLYNSGEDMKTTFEKAPSVSSSGKVDYRSYYTLDLEDWNYFIVRYKSGDTEEQTVDLTSSEFDDGAYYEFLWDSGAKLKKVSIYDYSFTIQTAETWSTFNVWMWSDTEDNILGESWPGKAASGSGTSFTFNHKSYNSSVLFLFNQGGDGYPKTCTMRTEPGSSSFYLCEGTRDDGYGEIVKTNSSGYSTYVTGRKLQMSSGVAYVAEDKGTWAKAYNITTAPYATPMLIKGTANTTYHFAEYDGDTSLPCTNAFVAGSDAGVDGGSGPYNYILKGDAFYRANGNTVASTKAYLQLSEEVPAGARAIVFEDGNVTSISAVNISKNDVYYNLQGVKVAQPTKGLYIVNGKKVSVK